MSRCAPSSPRSPGTHRDPGLPSATHSPSGPRGGAPSFPRAARGALRKGPVAAATAVAFSLLASCGKGGGGDAVRDILCGDGHAKGILTVGLDLGILGGLRAPGGATALSDEGVRGIINGALKEVVDPKYLSVAKVDSAVEGDSVRFLRLGGSFGAGFGVATSVLRSAAAKNPSMARLFTFVREGYKATAVAGFDETLHGGFARVASPLPVPGLGARADGSEGRSRSEGAGFALEEPGSGLSLAGAPAVPDERQWALAQTDFEGAMKILADKEREVRVAVIDTGVDVDHPDLKPILLPGYNAIDGSDRVDDDNGHGTHCAGIIASQAVGAGRAGAKDAPLGVAARSNVRIIPVKVLGGDGSGTSDSIEKGIRWAVKEAKADVISLSLGGGLEYAAVRKNGGLTDPVIADAIASGVIVVVAAGNEGCPLGGECKLPGFITSRAFKEYTVVPCAYEGTLCVGATDPEETLAAYSNFASGKSAAYRTRADVNAPGSRIYSTWPLDKGGPYKAISGTSMATPYVAGVAALLKANAKDPATVDQAFVKNALAKGLVDASEAKKKSGTGRVDLYATAYAFSRDHLGKERTDLPTPARTAKPVPTPGLPAEEEGGGALPVGNVWELLCALGG